MISSAPLWLVLVFLLRDALVVADLARLRANMDVQIEKDADNFHRARIADEDLLMVYQKWFETGVSSLFAAVANKKIKKLRRAVGEQFGACSAEATDIAKHAKCVSRLLKNEIEEQPRYQTRKKGRRLDRYRASGAAKDDAWIGGFRTRPKRAIKIRRSDGYRLSSNRRVMTPVGSVAKMLLESMKEAKNKTELPKWQDTVSKLKHNGARRKKLKKLVEEDSEESMDQLALRGIAEKVAPQSGYQPDLDIQELIDDPKKFDAFLKERRKKKQKPEEKLVGLIRQGLKLSYTLAGQNVSNFENRTMRIASPRFLGVVPEEQQDDAINLISPSLFALHDEGVGVENLTSLPNLLKHMGVPDDQQVWLDVIMEAAGVNEESDKLEKEVEDIEMGKTRSMMQNNMTSMVDESGMPMYATKENITQLGGTTEHSEMFAKLIKTYSKHQLRELNTTGYATLTKEQIQILYGPGSSASDPEAFSRFINLTEEQIHRQVHEDIHRMAELEQFRLVQRDVVLSPISFFPVILNPTIASQAFILSPIIFSPLVLSPSIFGAVVLSPWMFIPLILSPRILGCLILSPFIFSPVILTPIALHPVILSPGVFDPIVLSPFLLSPLILTPLVFAPMILNPICLSPLILSPSVGTPLVLSPFVLSPIIGSPLVLSALVLSPYALSPVIFSPLIAFAAVLSPSWLS